MGSCFILICDKGSLENTMPETKTSHFTSRYHKYDKQFIFFWSSSHDKNNEKWLVKDLQLDYLHSHQRPIYKHWVGVKWVSKSAYIISYTHIRIYESKPTWKHACHQANTWLWIQWLVRCNKLTGNATVKSRITGTI